MSHTNIPTQEVVAKTAEAIKNRNIEVFIVETKEEALKKIKELIPKGVSVHNGTSRTLQEIGFIDILKKGEHEWNNLHQAIVEEKDAIKQSELRQKSLFSDYYLGSVHAVSENGELVIASASGSQLPHIVFTSPNIIFVVGVQKIVPNLDSALKRLREHVYPLENDRMKSVGMGGSVLSKILILEQEPAFMGRTVRVIFVNEKLGF